ncbi:4'-phosphopantetheinyl transferase superfamily protein [Solwaraspora sp. WMMD406]|uniref:4'-phosphopantetheinyl transferase superfamily protein n=1 Tax=Solwaraspora sp. WMMD406 TaxID=3016095 RepID=UPI002417C088|nr:4'-phosphopantetheinyl transferase superfamily protein [Solwaraspora sp. WMMD406]MDG4765629.1 4'-phosphopantetheinyl transferase superfamily protein [Solwaraspora sp. WMMD406]
MTGLPALVGVDIAEVSRVARAVADLGDSYTRHVMTPAERAAAGDDAVAVTASVAMKECLIKAVGGRPAGFSWHDFDPVTGRRDDSARPVTRLLDEATGPVAQLLDEAAERLRAVTDLPLRHEVVHHVRGASRRAALARLTSGDAATTPVVGVARWGCHGDAVIALALLVVDNREER